MDPFPRLVAAGTLLAGLSLTLPVADAADDGRLAAAYPTVDVALVLAVDVSASIDDRERTIQREGYAEAITHPDVMRAIGEGAHGRILVTVVEWSDSFNQEIRVPWTKIDCAEDAARVADAIRKPGSSIPHSTTSLSGALWKAGRLLASAPEKAERQVVDVSGDGKDYETVSLSAARAALIKAGVTINGLPILSTPDDPDIATYYRTG